jgi:predicted nucleic acid-binding Zn ribbon protein
MLRPLRASLSGWSPRARGTRGEPLSVIAARWPQIVGPDLSRSTRPSSLSGDTLVVMTASSAWSQQLSFLAPEILRALGALPEAAAVKQLRFRVGRVAKRAAAAGYPGPRPGLHVAVGPAAETVPPATPEEALDRLRRQFARVEDAKRARGWKFCERCGVTIEGGSHCAPCAGSIADEREVATARVMYDAPWLGYAGTAEVVTALSVEEYERIRRALLERWWTLLTHAKTSGRLSADGRERKVASSYVVLQTGWEPQRITPAVVRNILGDELMNLLYGTK